jgi:hypothetical protein
MLFGLGRGLASNVFEMDWPEGWCAREKMAREYPYSLHRLIIEKQPLRFISEPQ